jgi:hypothetical protein
MIFPEYVEKKNIEEFLQENAFNQVCYKKILENETFKHRIDPLRFFNHLWYLHLLVMSNKNKPEKILDFIKKMHLPDEEEFLLLWDLDISFKKTIDPCITNEFSDIDLDVCLEWLDKEMIQLGHKIFAEDFEKEFLFNIETVLTNLKFYPNYQDKLIYLYNMKAKYENYAFSDDENKYFKFGELLDKITIDT